MTADTHRGHPITLVDGAWLYADTKQPVTENPGRKCGHCKRQNRLDGHDACLGEIPGAMNACCGHGNNRGYVQWPDTPSDRTP